MKRGILVLLVGCTGLTAPAAFGGSFPSPPLYPSFSAPRMATVTKFAPQGATEVSVFGLTEDGAVLGAYHDSAEIFHGFVRAPNGKITSFDAPGADAAANRGTFVDGSNNKGEAVGYYINAHGGFQPYIRTANGKFIEFRIHGANGAVASAINDHGVAVGHYLDVQHASHGFIRAANGTITKFDVSGAGTASSAGTDPNAINSSGTITGYYAADDLIPHGFVRAANGTVTKFLVTAAADDIIAINDSGAISGDYADKNGHFHAFLRTADGKIQRFEVPQSATGEGTLGGGVNSKNVVVGFYGSKHNNKGGYERRANGTFVLFDDHILPLLINDNGVIAGDANGGSKAFIRMP